MKIIQITPGAGDMICGACLRDHALARTLNAMGHSVLLTPLYLPVHLEEKREGDVNAPIFFTGVNVYLEQKFPWYRRVPGWLHHLMASRSLLRWVSRSAGKTQPSQLGELTLSMLRGEDGNQVRELNELIAWLKTEKPDLVCLGNALLVGLARRIKEALGVPVVCTLQGEDFYLDSLPPKFQERAWAIARARAREIDLFVAPSRFFAQTMIRRLELNPERVSVVWNGVNVEGIEPAGNPPESPTIGYFARMSPEKGLEDLVDAFLYLKRQNRIPGLRLRIGGYCGPGNKRFVDSLLEKLRTYKANVDFCPNLSRVEKLAFLRANTVFCVPATYGEAFGLYILESLACGVPVVEPDHAAFPELLLATGGGVMFKPLDISAMADGLESLLSQPAKARKMGEVGRKAVLEQFSIQEMAENILRNYKALLGQS
jgi:glycosyltransferase involved in cell wall biosynthesis